MDMNGSAPIAGLLHKSAPGSVLRSEAKTWNPAFSNIGLLIRYGLARNGLHATGSAASLAASGHQQERQKTFFPESQGIVARHLLFNGCKGLRRSKGRSCNSGRVHHKGTFLNKDMAIQHKSLVIKNRP